MRNRLKAFAGASPQRAGEFLFWFSLSLAGLALYVFVNTYPFSPISVEVMSQYVPWVQSLTPKSNPYKYWYPLALVCVPLGTFAMWRLLCRVAGLSFPKRRVELAKAYARPRVPVFSTSIILFGLAVLLTNFSYAAFYLFFVNFHHFNYITGPLNDLLNGKVLLVNSKTQYGFLNIFLASWLFRGPLYFSHPNVHFLSMILTFVEYAAYYLTLRILTRSTLWSLVGILFTVSVHYYGSFPELFPSELPLWPGNTWRFSFAAVASLAILNWLNRRTRTSFVVSQALVAMALFWQFESGICLVGAYLACLVSECLWVEERSSVSSAKTLGLRMLSLLAFMAAIVIGYSIYTYGAVGKFPDWTMLTHYARVFNNGLLQGEGIPARLQWYWPIGLYGVLLIAIFGWAYLGWNFRARNLSYLVCTLVYGFGIFRYYLGYANFNWRPIAVVVPACIVFTYLAQQVFEGFPRAKGGSRIAMAVLGVAIVAIFSCHAYNVVHWTYALGKNRWTNLKELSNPQSNVPPRNRLIAYEATTATTPLADLVSTIENIKHYVPEGQPIALIAYHDHPILMQANRVNLADAWYLSHDIYFRTEMDQLEKLFETSAEYLFVEKDLLRDSPELLNKLEGKTAIGNLLALFMRLRDSFRFEADIGVLYVYKRVRG
jgi:hypothetical protein